jgi:IclR family acetate operon transcriptional repressor
MSTPGVDPAYASARRAFRIIDRVSRGGGGLDARDLARSLEISPSTCYQLLGVLIEGGYLDRLPNGGGYALGPTLERLYQRARSTSIETVVHPILDGLQRRSGCPAFFAVLTEQDDVVVTEASPSATGAPVGLPPGLRAPAHALALGKAQIAAGGVRAIDRYLDTHPLDSLTPRTITDPVVLEAHFKLTHARGYATESEEFAKHLWGLAVPVLTEDGQIAGAVGLATPGGAGSDGHERLLELTRDAARQVSAGVHAEPDPAPLRRVSG